jgi:precorrin-6y C5,15-methyltransferase (decarboxylating) CbiE subunit
MALTPITIIGCGPGARECLTLEAMSAIQQAEVLIGTPRLLALFPELTAPAVPVAGRRAELFAAIEQHRDRKLAVLVTGDPGLASLAALIVERFGLAACRIIPGISSVQVAFARLGLSWERVRVLSAHAACPQYDSALLQRETAIAVLSGDANSQVWISSLAAALGPRWQATVAENLTLPDERVFIASPGELAKIPQPMRAVIIFQRTEKA